MEVRFRKIKKIIKNQTKQKHYIEKTKSEPKSSKKN